MGKSSDWAHRTSTPLYILSNSTKTRSLDCSSSPRIQSLLELFFLFFSPFFFLDFIALVWIFFSGLVFNSLKTGVCALNTKSNTVISSSEVWTHRRDFGTKLTSLLLLFNIKKMLKVLKGISWDHLFEIYHSHYGLQPYPFNDFFLEN